MLSMKRIRFQTAVIAELTTPTLGILACIFSEASKVIWPATSCNFWIAPEFPAHRPHGCCFHPRIKCNELFTFWIAHMNFTCIMIIVMYNCPCYTHTRARARTHTHTHCDTDHSIQLIMSGLSRHSSSFQLNHITIETLLQCAHRYSHELWIASYKDRLKQR